jgi:hypothetical protein
MWTFQGRMPVFRSLLLLLATCARFQTLLLEEPGKRREKWYALDGDASAFTQRSALLCNPLTLLSCQMYYRALLLGVQKSGNGSRFAARLSSPAMNGGAFRRNGNIVPYLLLCYTFR